MELNLGCILWGLASISMGFNKETRVFYGREASRDWFLAGHPCCFVISSLPLGCNLNTRFPNAHNWCLCGHLLYLVLQWKVGVGKRMANPVIWKSIGDTLNFVAKRGDKRHFNAMLKRALTKEGKRGSTYTKYLFGVTSYSVKSSSVSWPIACNHA